MNFLNPDITQGQVMLISEGSFFNRVYFFLKTNLTNFGIWQSQRYGIYTLKNKTSDLPILKVLKIVSWKQCNSVSNEPIFSTHYLFNTARRLCALNIKIQHFLKSSILLLLINNIDSLSNDNITFIWFFDFYNSILLTKRHHTDIWWGNFFDKSLIRS